MDVYIYIHIHICIYICICTYLNINAFVCVLCWGVSVFMFIQDSMSWGLVSGVSCQGGFAGECTRECTREWVWLRRFFAYWRGQEERDSRIRRQSFARVTLNYIHVFQCCACALVRVRKKERIRDRSNSGVGGWGAMSIWSQCSVWLKISLIASYDSRI